MKTFLLPVDFSDNTMSLVKYAFYLAGSEKTHFYLFHIYPDQFIVPDSSLPVGVDSDAFFSAGFGFVESLREQAETNMEKLKKAIFELAEKEAGANIEVSHRLSGGDPDWAVQSICEEIKPDLIVMGTEGEGKKGFLEGSIAESVMAATKVPVVAVPVASNRDHIHHVMYATNFDGPDVSAIRKAFALLKHAQLRIHVVHFLFDEKDEEQKVQMDKLEKIFADQRRSGTMSFHLVQASDKRDVLPAFADAYQIDLVAFLSHKTGFFRNLFSTRIRKKDFFKLGIPLLALHGEA